MLNDVVSCLRKAIGDGASTALDDALSSIMTYAPVFFNTTHGVMGFQQFRTNLDSCLRGAVDQLKALGEGPVAAAVEKIRDTLPTTPDGFSAAWLQTVFGSLIPPMLVPHDISEFTRYMDDVKRVFIQCFGRALIIYPEHVLKLKVAPFALTMSVGDVVRSILGEEELGEEEGEGWGEGEGGGEEGGEGGLGGEG